MDGLGGDLSSLVWGANTRSLNGLNAGGQAGAAPNRLEPDKRPFHILIPAMLFANGEPSMVYGTMGSEGQASDPGSRRHTHRRLRLRRPARHSSTSLVVRSDLGQASAALTLEASFPPSVADRLATMGHDAQIVPPWSGTMGHAQAISIDRKRGPRPVGVGYGCW